MDGTQRIAKERERQITKEGWTLEHDSNHCNYELTAAALHYAFEATREGLESRLYPDDEDWILPFWPWETTEWKPTQTGGNYITKKDSIRMLEKAGALIAAEIDRLLRKCTK